MWPRRRFRETVVRFPSDAQKSQLQPLHNSIANQLRPPKLAECFGSKQIKDQSYRIIMCQSHIRRAVTPLSPFFLPYTHWSNEIIVYLLLFTLPVFFRVWATLFQFQTKPCLFLRHCTSVSSWAIIHRFVKLQTTIYHITLCKPVSSWQFLLRGAIQSTVQYSTFTARHIHAPCRVYS